MLNTHILIADSSSLTVVGAETLLRQRGDTLISKAENADDLLALASELKPSLILLGDRFDPLYDTIDLAERLLGAAPSVSLVIMGISTEGLIIRDFFAMGVRGYLAAADDLSECLLTAVEMVLRGRPYLSPIANAEYLITMQGSNRGWQLDAEARAILRLLAGGCTPHQIAARLKLKRRRVYWVVEKLRFRFGATTNEHLISRAVNEGFAGFPD